MSTLVSTPLETFHFEAPGGLVHVVRTPEDGLVRASGYGSAENSHARLTADLRLRDLTEAAPDSDLADAFARYADGDLSALSSVAVSQPGGAFTQAAWEALRHIPAGRTFTYSELAAAAGNPLAIRAAASACARNLVAVIVPCHRVIRRDGSLGGFYYGLPTKRALLAHEGFARYAA